MYFPSRSRSSGPPNPTPGTPSTSLPDISSFGLAPDPQYGASTNDDTAYGDSPLQHYTPHPGSASTSGSMHDSNSPADDLFGSLSGPTISSNKRRRYLSVDSIENGIDEEGAARVVKKRRGEYANDVVNRHGIEGSDAKQLWNLSQGDVMMVLLEFVGRQMAGEVRQKAEMVRNSLETTTFKEKIGSRIKTTLVYPSLAMYKKKLPDRIFDLCIKDPTAWDLSNNFEGDGGTAQLVKEKIGGALHTARNQLKSNIRNSIANKQNIAALVKTCIPKGATATPAMLGRISFLRYAFADFISRIAESPTGFKITLDGTVLQYKKDAFWDYVDDSLVKLRTREEGESTEDRNKRVDEGLKDILQSDRDLYNGDTDNDGLAFDTMHSWQQKLFNDLASL